MSAHWLNDDGSLAWGLWVAKVSDEFLPEVIREQALYLTSEDSPGDSCTHRTLVHSTVIHSEDGAQVAEIVTFDGCVAWRVS